MLEQNLGDDQTITTQAATILRALIEGIVLHPRKTRGSGKKRATMSIEVCGEPSALFLPDNDEASDGHDRMLTVVAEDRSVHSPLPVFALNLGRVLINSPVIRGSRCPLSGGKQT